jgi:hypothetical protein
MKEIPRIRRSPLWNQIGRLGPFSSIWLGLAGCLSLPADESALREPLGPSSRRTPIVISEIMYHPAPRSDGRNLEYVELYNSQPWVQDLSGYSLVGDIDFVFPANTLLASNAFVVVAGVAGDLQTLYPEAKVLGNYVGSLSDKTGTLRLEHRNGGVLLEVQHSRVSPWPAAAAGAGHSLILARPSLGEGDPRAWSASARVGGSPGAFEPDIQDPLSALCINEFLASGGADAPDFVELYNAGPVTLELRDCGISDDPLRNRFLLPAGTTLGAGAFLRFDSVRLGFGLKRSGGALYLWNAGRTAVLDAVRYGPQDDGLSSGRFPNGSPGFRPLAKPTPETSNEALWLGDIVINEIMYDPISQDGADEYLELYNRGARSIDVGGWQFVDGITFVIPSGTVMAPGSYLVVARDSVRLLSRYPNLNSANTVGNFTAALANGGERIALARADGVIVEQVTYGVGGRWGRWAHGGGSSLERTDPRGDPNLAENWADSDESDKAPWTTVQFTGTLNSYGLGPLGLGSLYVVLLGAGECLIDKVEVFKAGGANVVTNPTFEAGLSGWFGQGNHERIQWEPAGFDDRGSLRLSASDGGETMMNRLGARLSAGLAYNSITTVRAQVRWQQGCPEVLLRLIGNQLEAYGRLNVPTHLGTPGLRNSRAVANAGPAFADVRHLPTLPAPQQAIVVTAQVADPDGLSKVLLHYRIDPSTNLISVAMNDLGGEGDSVSGDGVFSGSIPGQPSGSLVAFHISASDGATEAGQASYPADAPNREGLVRVGEITPPGPFVTCRLWMTLANMQRWQRRDPANDEPLDATFVYGEARVVHNVGAFYAGRGAMLYYNGPTNRSCDYKLLFPETDRFLGATDVQLSWPGMGGRLPDATLQTEQAAFWLAEQAGLPTCHRRFVFLFFNGIRRGELVEDSQRPNGDYVEEWFPQDSGGELYALHNQWETGDQGISTGVSDSSRALRQIKIPTNTPPERAYRWVWNKRGGAVSKNDLQSVYALLDAFNVTNSQGFTDGVDALVDVEQWMRTLAVERAVGNWDSFGFVNDQNMYFYKPSGGKWRLCIWDMDLLLGMRAGEPTFGVPSQVWTSPANHSIFSHLVDVYTFSGLTVSPPEIRFLKNPPFARIYLRSLESLIEGPMLRMNDLLDTKQAVFAANGFITETKDSKLADAKNYVTQRIDSIRKQLAAYRVPFGIAIHDTTTVTNAEPAFILTGTASFQAATIKVNGRSSPVIWTTLTNWSVNVPLTGGTNWLNVVGFDVAGNALPDAYASVIVVYQGPPAPLRLQRDYLVNHGLILSWAAVPGKKYRLESKSDLNDQTWTAEDEVVPETSLARLTNYFEEKPQRFYRLVEP